MSPLDRFGAFVGLVKDSAYSAGPLAGLRVAVKDNIAVTGQPFTAGHPLFLERRADSDAEAVRRLRKAGAKIVGVTRTHAGGLGVTTPDVQNPIARDRTVGGSSGGSAAAVAAHLADIALGTDTGGSVRIPAACTGLIGFKPTLGAIPTQGTWPLSQSFDHVGLIGRGLRQVERTAHILLESALQGVDDQRSVSRIGVFPDLNRCHPEVLALFQQVIASCRSAGLETISIALPSLEEILDAHRTIVLAEAADVYRPYAADRLAGLAQRSLAFATTISSYDVDHAHATIAVARAAIETAFNQVDMILAPTLPCAVPARDERQIEIQGDPISVIAALMSFTAPFNVSGHPAVSLPTSLTLHNIPFSIQLVGPLRTDRQLLRNVGTFPGLHRAAVDNRRF